MNASPALLLPSNATAWERAVERASAERWPLDADIIRRAKNAWECPPELLPYLAYEFSVDLWNEAWPLVKKRAVIAGALRLAALKGTEAGLTQAIAIMGGEVREVVAPPNTLFLTVTRTPEEKAAWLAKMPQLRIYPKRIPAPFAGLYVGRHLEGFTLKSEAFFHATPRVTLWRRGVETELLTLERRRQDDTITQAEEFIEARDKGPSPGFHIGQALGGFLHRSRASERVYTIRTRSTLTIPGSDALAAEFAQPSLTPIDVRAETIREAAPVFGIWSGGAILGAGVSRYLVNSRARLHVFKRVHLYDPEIPAQAHAGRTFLGYNFRFGQPAFTAEIKVEIRQKRPPAAFSPFVYGFMVAPDPSAKRGVLDAVRTHQARRDRILINTHTRDVARAGAGFIAGEQAIAGRIVAV